ncbi:DUF6079 family protein [Frankia sp. Cas3]|uniref:DUF6079 family protein n=1 Tax=Frankia sp. Cas3 TaxID=3073926 RepID=UPI002AD1E25D|nr:DUF6079 family protein [Frankia sp. Cas3]
MLVTTVDAGTVQDKGVAVSTLLRDVITIPEHAGAEDYVLRLTDGVERDHLQVTLSSYVVTDQIADAFDRALALVADAVRTGTSRAAFLTGSFGSGKSHFMAVLHAILGHVPEARALPDLQPAIARHDPTLGNRRILRLAFHLLTAESMEQAVLGGYLAQIRTLHPDADLPAIHHSDAILADAERMRARRGDAAFFADLNGTSPDGERSADDIWSRAGILGVGTWTVVEYDQARAAAPGTEQRQKLVTALVNAYYSSYTAQADYVDLDSGLAAISRHAKGLGYDAVVLFLDELVLWLAHSVRDKEFFRREAQKLTKLVESSTGPRDVPLVSFVARQIDLRKWFAESGASGAEQDALDQAFRHQEGRFATIVLGDDNLPRVASRRLLAPKSPAAARVLSDAFARLERRRELWDVLLDGVNTDSRHRGADEDAFRLTFPFSPALVSTLRSLAGIMQRERTALKVMQKMLVDRRDTLTVDDVIPVGDAFDDIVEGQEPLDQVAANRFRAASSLYRRRLRPVLLAGYGLTEELLAADPASAPPALLAEERIAKTLLLAAVAPDVPALKDLTASRLASLNHGSIASPLPGGEGPVVLAKVRGWHSKIPEIQIGDEPRHPVIRMRLAEVNYESVVDRARGEDNDGRRRELIKTLVHEALGVAARNPDTYGAITHPVSWRGSAREVDLVFGNVRDASWLTEDHFRSRTGTWRFVIDYPFDELDQPATADLARIDQMKVAGFTAQTAVWLPRYLSAETMRNLRRLVVLEWLFTGPGDRWTSHCDHLSEADRMEARAILASQRTALRSQIQAALQQAYGAASPVPGVLVDDLAHDRVLDSFDPRLGGPAEPVGADLHAAFVNLIDQVFTASYPAHPRFEPGDVDVRTRELAIVAATVEKAVADRDGRIILDPGDRPAMRHITGPLRIGSTGETAFVFGDDQFAFWTSHLERAATRAGVGLHDPVRVGQLRSWIDAIEPAMGLRREVSDLVISAWASLRQRAWYHLGGPIEVPRPGAIRDECELRPEPMPPTATWNVAIRRAGAIFGVPVSTHLTSATVGALDKKVRAEAAALATGAAKLVDQVRDAYERLNVPLDPETGRLATARAVATLVDRIYRAGDRVQLVAVLADTSGVTVTDEALGRSLKSATDLSDTLAVYRWDHLAPLLAGGRDNRLGWNERASREATVILDRLSVAVRADELADPLIPVLDQARDDLFALITRLATTPSSSPAVGAASAGVASVPSSQSSSSSQSQSQSASASASTEPSPLARSSSVAPPGPVARPESAHPDFPLRVVRRRGQGMDEAIAVIRQVLADHPDADVELTWRVLP